MGERKQMETEGQVQRYVIIKHNMIRTMLVMVLILMLSTDGWRLMEDNNIDRI